MVERKSVIFADLCILIKKVCLPIFSKIVLSMTLIFQGQTVGISLFGISLGNFTKMAELKKYFLNSCTVRQGLQPTCRGHWTSFQGQTFGILLFHCNSKMIGSRTMNFSIHMHGKWAYVVNFKPDHRCSCLHLKIRLLNCYCFCCTQLVHWNGVIPNILTLLLNERRLIQFLLYPSLI